MDPLYKVVCVEKAEPMGDTHQTGVNMELDINMLVSTVVYAAVGVLFMGLCFKLVTIVAVQRS